MAVVGSDRRWRGAQVLQSADPLAVAREVAAELGCEAVIGWDDALAAVRHLNNVTLSTAARRAAERLIELEARGDDLRRAEAHHAALASGRPTSVPTEVIRRLVTDLDRRRHDVIARQAEVGALPADPAVLGRFSAASQGLSQERWRLTRATHLARGLGIAALGALFIVVGTGRLDPLSAGSIAVVLVAVIIYLVLNSSSRVADAGDKVEARRTVLAMEGIDDVDAARADLAEWARRRAAAQKALARLDEAEDTWRRALPTVAPDDAPDMLWRMEASDRAAAALESIRGDAVALVVARSTTLETWLSILQRVGLPLDLPADELPLVLERIDERAAPDRIERPIVVCCERDDGDGPPPPEVLDEVRRCAESRSVVLVTRQPDVAGWNMTAWDLAGRDMAGRDAETTDELDTADGTVDGGE